MLIRRLWRSPLYRKQRKEIIQRCFSAARWYIRQHQASIEPPPRETYLGLRELQRIVAAAAGPRSSRTNKALLRAGGKLRYRPNSADLLPARIVSLLRSTAIGLLSARQPDAQMVSRQDAVHAFEAAMKVLDRLLQTGTDIGECGPQQHAALLAQMRSVAQSDRDQLANLLTWLRHAVAQERPRLERMAAQAHSVRQGPAGKAPFRHRPHSRGRTHLDGVIVNLWSMQLKFNHRLPRTSVTSPKLGRRRTASGPFLRLITGFLGVLKADLLPEVLSELPWLKAELNSTPDALRARISRLKLTANEARRRFGP